MPRRTATVVLCDDTRVLGVLPPFDVEAPWWPAADPVVEGVRRLHDIGIVVLRMLEVDTAKPVDGGRVSYLAQVDEVPDLVLLPWLGPDPMVDHPLRAPYARPGGPQADVRWAQTELARSGRTVAGPPEQIKTWNLASIWQLPTTDGPVWLKSAPPMFAAEAALVAALQDGPVPRLIAGVPGRMLTADIPGIDHYFAGPRLRGEMLDLLLALQAEWVDDPAALLTIGVRDGRLASSVDPIRAVFERYAVGLPAESRRSLERLVGRLPALVSDIESCGLPDTLVHGDFHPGNVRGVEGRLILLDWADAVVGNPALDWLRFAGWQPENCPPPLRERWVRSWRETVPGCDPVRALELLPPFAALLGAAGYQRFLDNIEPDEYPYHAGDPLACLLAAVG